MLPLLRRRLLALLPAWASLPALWSRPAPAAPASRFRADSPPARPRGCFCSVCNGQLDALLDEQPPPAPLP